MSITSGWSWGQCLLPLGTGPGVVYQYIFVIYIFFAQICVLNIVTGVFVDTVHQMYEPERDELIRREMSKRKQIINIMMDLFEEADEDGSGHITWPEFEEFMSDERVQYYCASLEIDIHKAREIFDLIDLDTSGEVSIDEFVQGFMEMKGAAKGVDIAM